MDIRFYLSERPNLFFSVMELAENTEIIDPVYPFLPDLHATNCFINALPGATFLARTDFFDDMVSAEFDTWAKPLFITKANYVSRGLREFLLNVMDLTSLQIQALETQELIMMMKRWAPGFDMEDDLGALAAYNGPDYGGIPYHKRFSTYFSDEGKLNKTIRCDDPLVSCLPGASFSDKESIFHRIHNEAFEKWAAQNAVDLNFYKLDDSQQKIMRSLGFLAVDVQEMTANEIQTILAGEGCSTVVVDERHTHMAYQSRPHFPAVEMA